MKVQVVCIAAMHQFSVDVEAADISCPVCGCRYVRRATHKGESVEVVVEPGRHALPVRSWLTDRREFAKLAREAYPEASEDQIAEMMRE